MLMGEIECKPPTQVIIEASIISTSPDKSHSLSINNVTEPSSSSILTRLFRISLFLGGQAMLRKILIESNGVSQDVWHVFRKLPSTICLLLWCLAFFNTNFTVLCLHPRMFLSLPLGEGRVRSPYRSKLLVMGYLAPICTNSFSRY